jgi:hypothetical protein
MPTQACRLENHAADGAARRFIASATDAIANCRFTFRTATASIVLVAAAEDPLDVASGHR